MPCYKLETQTEGKYCNSTAQYSTVQYCTVQHSTLQCSTARTVQYNSIQYSTVQSWGYSGQVRRIFFILLTLDSSGHKTPVYASYLVKDFYEKKLKYSLSITNTGYTNSDRYSLKAVIWAYFLN